METGTAQAQAADGDLVSELRELLVEASEGKLSAEEIDPAANIFDYGYVDSLSAVNFVLRIEERWGLHIDDMDLVERLTTLEAIAGHVRAGA